MIRHYKSIIKRFTIPFPKSIVVALLVLVLLLIFWRYLGNWYHHQLLVEARNIGNTLLIPKGNSLSSTINRDFALMNGLVAFVESHPVLTELEAHFHTFAAGLLSGEHSIRVIQVFPKEIPVLAYPIKGNEAIIGRKLEDLINDERPGVREDVQRTLDRRLITLSGPYGLRQGGLGIVARRAVFRNDDLWAMVTVVLDIPRIIANSGLKRLDSGMRLALRRKNADIFWGDEETFLVDPVIYPIVLPEGEWILAAVPEEGWRKAFSKSYKTFMVIGLVVVLGLTLLVFIILERQRFLTGQVEEGSSNLQIEQAKRKQAEEWRQLAVRSANIGLWDWDLRSNKVIYSPEWKSQIGYEDHEISNNFSEWEDRVHPDDLERSIETVRAFIASPWPDYHLEFRFRHRDDSYRWILTQASLLYDTDNRPVRMIGCHLDITERKQREDDIRKRNRTHTMLSKINQTILRERSKDMLFSSACRIAVEYGQYRMAWFGTVESKTNEIVPVASAGMSDDDVQKLRLVHEKQARSESPAGRAVREGRHVICNDIENDPIMVAWRTEALRLGWRAFAVFPLTIDEKNVGVFNLYAAERFFFNDEEIKLLDELVLNISFALNSRYQEDHRRLAEKVLRESEARAKAVADFSPVGIYMNATDGSTIYTNHALQEMLGVPLEQTLGFAWVELIHPEDRQLVINSWERFVAGTDAVFNMESRWVRPDRTERVLHVRSARIYEGRRLLGYAGSAVDVTERKKMEEILKEREALLRETGKIAKIGGWEFIPTTLELTWTEEIARIFDQDPWEKTNVQSELSVFHGEHRDKIERAVKDAIEIGKPYDLELEMITVKGNRKWVRTIGHPILEEDKVIKVRGSLQEISDRKSAEEALRNSEKRFRTAFEHSANGMCLTGLDGTLLKVNAALSNMLGYTKEELEGMHFNHITHPEDTEIGNDVIQKMIDGRTPSVTFEKRYITKTGESIWTYINSALLKDASDQPLYFITQTEDITSRKKAEEEIKLYNERLSILREIDKDIILSREPKKMVDMVLKRIRKLIPCRRAGLLFIEEDLKEGHIYSTDHDYESAFVTMTRVTFTPKVIEILTSGEIFFINDHRIVSHADYPYSKKLADEGILASIFVPLIASNQTIGAFHLGSDQVGFFTDVHREIIEEIANKLAVALNHARLNEKIERQNIELEKRIQERTVELEAKNKELETFTYSVSHDLKAPLRGIDGYSRLLQEDFSERMNEEGRFFLNNVRQATAQMNQLIDDLLAYSRVERRSRQLEEVNPKEIIESILKGYSDEITKRGIIVEMDVPQINISTDPAGLNLVLRNLLDNAFKFTRDVSSPVIEVGGKESDSSSILWVRDNGIGFSMKFHKRIFEIFQRLHRYEDFPGTGVGLAIARKAVERMEGRIRAESEMGKGATFYLEIPRPS